MGHNFKIWQAGFWKCWRAKFDNTCSRSQQVDGLSDDVNITSAFAAFFAKACAWNKL